MKALDKDHEGNPKALVKINVRLPEYVVEYFKEKTNYSAEIRKVLGEYVDNQRCE